MKKRRNALARNAAARRSGEPTDPGAVEALTDSIRRIDSMLGLLEKAHNKRSWNFRVDLLDPIIEEMGFGLDSNGNFPAL